MHNSAEVSATDEVEGRYEFSLVQSPEHACIERKQWTLNSDLCFPTKIMLNGFMLDPARNRYFLLLSLKRRAVIEVKLPT